MDFERSKGKDVRNPDNSRRPRARKGRGAKSPSGGIRGKGDPGPPPPPPPPTQQQSIPEAAENRSSRKSAEAEMPGPLRRVAAAERSGRETERLRER
ncbi:hypothetical protein NL676_026197 [Syzygium grande]|nr:hypothetical protein NL676_026197 [Syzygium grande]